MFGGKRLSEGSDQTAFLRTEAFLFIFFYYKLWKLDFIPESTFETVEVGIWLVSPFCLEDEEEVSFFVPLF